jgi:hypothetical protein
VVLNTKNPNLFLIYLHEMQYLMMYKHLQIDMNTPIRLLIPDTPPSMREKLIQLKSKDLGLCRLDLHMTKYTQSLILCIHVAALSQFLLVFICILIDLY